jgi:hypothetical protein
MRSNTVIDVTASAVKPTRKTTYYGRWYQLYDSLSLTKTIFPDILQLMNIDDYRNDMMALLGNHGRQQLPEGCGL